MSGSDSRPGAPASDQPGQSATRTGPRPTTDDPTASHTTSTSLLQDLESLTEAVASNLPASQHNPKNRKHITATEKVMRAYFKRLEIAFPHRKVGVLYNRYLAD
ncbi:hypothetical protein LCGC14_2566140 [marine sediment metagenome]|uniref:Uncharacterized protein n=1 Tax=marine sediment metagenome TaxID=412755 RepID=A0A0F9AIJ0_9ZZZZ